VNLTKLLKQFSDRVGWGAILALAFVRLVAYLPDRDSWQFGVGVLMSQIDDPIEAVKQQYPEQSKSPISVMLEVLGPWYWYPFVGLVNVFKQFASQSETNGRVRALFEVLESYVRQAQ